MEDADDVVGRGVADSLLVAVVEAVEPGDEDPAGERQGEQEEFSVRVKPPVASRQQRRGEVGQRHSKEVGHDQGARDDLGPSGAGPPFEQAARAIVDRLERIFAGGSSGVDIASEGQIAASRKHIDSRGGGHSR